MLYITLYIVSIIAHATANPQVFALKNVRITSAEWTTTVSLIITLSLIWYLFIVFTHDIHCHDVYIHPHSNYNDMFIATKP